jgi:hypothetical protein
MVFTSQQTLLFGFDISFNTGQAYVSGGFSRLGRGANSHPPLKKEDMLWDY